MIQLRGVEIEFDESTVTVAPMCGGRNVSGLAGMPQVYPDTSGDELVAEWTCHCESQEVTGIGVFASGKGLLFVLGLESHPNGVVLRKGDTLTARVPLVRPEPTGEAGRLITKMASLLQDTYLDTSRTQADLIAARRIWSYLASQGVRTEPEVAQIVAAAGGSVTYDPDRPPLRVRESRSPYGDVRLETY